MEAKVSAVDERPVISCFVSYGVSCVLFWGQHFVSGAGGPQAATVVPCIWRRVMKGGPRGEGRKSPRRSRGLCPSPLMVLVALSSSWECF